MIDQCLVPTLAVFQPYRGMNKLYKTRNSKNDNFYIKCILFQGLGFLNHYLELRGETQESYYNLGRALHLLGML